MKKRLLFLIFALCLFLIPFAESYFTKDHTYWVLKAMSEVNSPITQLCAGKEQLLIDGNVGTDSVVLHYFEDTQTSGFKSYVFTHSRGAGFDECMRQAGSDPDLKCFCIGAGTHQVQDSFSHLDGGLVALYLKKSFAPNLLGHMVIEKDFELRHMALIEENDPSFASKVEEYAGFSEYSSLCNSFFEDKGGDYKYVQLLNDMAGINVVQDLNLFCNGYKDTSFYDYVYNEKVKLPTFVWAICFGLILIGLGMMYIAIRYGTTSWKWIIVFIFLIIAVLGGLILVAIQTNNTWSWISAGLTIPTKLGLLSVSEYDLNDYNQKVLDATKQFLETGDLPHDDVSGLSYVDSEGNKVNGALSEAESSFKFVLLPIIVVILTIFTVWMFKKAKLKFNQKIQARSL